VAPRARIALAAGDTIIDETEAELPITIGRGEDYERGRGRLALKKAAQGSETEEEIHVFKGVYARFGCRSDEEDCTSRRHVRLEPKPDGILVINEGRYPIYIDGDEVPPEGTKLVKSAVIQLPGIYTVDERRARILINMPQPPMPSEICRIIQDSLTSLGQFIDHVKNLALQPGTSAEIEDLKQRLRPEVAHIKGRFRGLEQYAKGRYLNIAEIASGVLREIDTLEDLILGLPHLAAVLSKLSELHTMLALQRKELCRE